MFQHDLDGVQSVMDAMTELMLLYVDACPNTTTWEKRAAKKVEKIKMRALNAANETRK